MPIMANDKFETLPRPKNEAYMDGEWVAYDACQCTEEPYRNPNPKLFVFIGISAWLKVGGEPLERDKQRYRIFKKIKTTG